MTRTRTHGCSAATIGRARSSASNSSNPSAPPPAMATRSRLFGLLRRGGADARRRPAEPGRGADVAAVAEPVAEAGRARRTAPRRRRRPPSRRRARRRSSSRRPRARPRAASAAEPWRGRRGCPAARAPSSPACPREPPASGRARPSRRAACGPRARRPVRSSTRRCGCVSLRSASTSRNGADRETGAQWPGPHLPDRRQLEVVVSRGGGEELPERGVGDREHAALRPGGQELPRQQRRTPQVSETEPVLRVDQHAGRRRIGAHR